MSKKLELGPDASYMLGIYRCNRSERLLRLSTHSEEMVERFVKIAVMNLGTKSEAISISKNARLITAEIGNSKLKKLLDNALESRERIFKYKNEYSASYFAAVFDCNSGLDGRGIFIRGMDAHDKIILERLGFHTTASSGRLRIRNIKGFVEFIEPYSIMAPLFIHKQTK